MENPYRKQEPILNAQYILVTEENEYRMSHWVKGFGILDKDGNDIMPLNTSLDLNEFEEVDNHRISANFDVYPSRSLNYTIIVDVEDKTFICEDKKRPLSELKNFFDEIANQFMAELYRKRD